MCGLSGFIDTGSERSPADRRAIVEAMTRTIAHRGPDGQGIWQSDDGVVALGHRRLAIIDLSPAGFQPMLSADGRFVVVYNGEGYNADDLRQQLLAAGHGFRGHSDTEVLCEGFSRWGVSATVRRFNGMFSIAVWDRAERRLWLVRDRLGIKPLFWARFGSLIVFGSELKALRAHPGWTPELDRDAVAAFLRYGYVPAPMTIYQGVAKVLPGQILSFDLNGAIDGETYWSIDTVADAGLANGDRLPDEKTTIEEAEALLTDAVKRQMVSDVPIGTFLSGGIDSSLVAALMRKTATGEVKTFAIAFSEADYNEADHAAAVARHLGCTHTGLTFTAADALALVPRLADIYDEPFADSSQLPTLVLSSLTRAHVTVALSGDGGDEVFGGYNRYIWQKRLSATVGRLPDPLRHLAAGALRGVPAKRWAAIARGLPGGVRPARLADKVHKLADVLELDAMAMYRRLVSCWPEPGLIAADGRDPENRAWFETRARAATDAVDRMQILDTRTYLPDDVLTKVDRASMAASLEARVPLLDHRVVEFAWTLPQRMKVRDGQGKWLARRVLDRFVPRALIDRPKMGFGVPIDNWLGGPLKAWAEDLLDPAALADGGLVNPEPVRQAWRDHLDGVHNRQHQLWTVLMLESWRRRWFS